MSEYYNLVINASFPKTIQEQHLKVLHWLTDTQYVLDFTPSLPVFYHNQKELLFEDVWKMMGHVYIPHLLSHDPEREIISNFKWVSYGGIRNFWLLQYVCYRIHEDTFDNAHRPCAYWLASIAEAGLFGYYCNADHPSDGTHLLFSHGGSFEIVDIKSPLKSPTLASHEGK
jgi:hypothetical protein